MNVSGAWLVERASGDDQMGEREGERNLDGTSAGELGAKRLTALVGARPEHEAAVGIVDRRQELTEKPRSDDGPVEIDDGHGHATHGQAPDDEPPRPGRS